jgi:hypothetical protein
MPETTCFGTPVRMIAIGETHCPGIHFSHIENTSRLSRSEDLLYVSPCGSQDETVHRHAYGVILSLPHRRRIGCVKVVSRLSLFVPSVPKGFGPSSLQRVCSGKGSLQMDRVRHLSSTLYRYAIAPGVLLTTSLSNATQCYVVFSLFEIPALLH